MTDVPKKRVKSPRLEISNLEREKRKFLFDPNYNPQFSYQDEPPTPQQLHKYGAVSPDLLPLAERILNTVLKEYENEESFVEEEGRKISREETTQRVQAYLEKCGLEDSIRISYSPKYIARTSVARKDGETELRIRLPIDYREHNLEPILNHEIGTHVYRWLNEERQPWYRKHRDFALNEYLETEEGLAVLNAMTTHPAPYLWMPALYYFTTYHAQFLSFAELSQKLTPFLQDPERRFKTCLRAKRGLVDTSEPGGYTKDQVYFSGTIKVARWLHKNKYNPEKLYYGKLDLADLKRAEVITGNFEATLPDFMKTTEYTQNLQQVIKLNGLL